MSSQGNWLQVTFTAYTSHLENLNASINKDPISFCLTHLAVPQILHSTNSAHKRSVKFYKYTLTRLGVPDAMPVEISLDHFVAGSRPRSGNTPVDLTSSPRQQPPGRPHMKRPHPDVLTWCKKKKRCTVQIEASGPLVLCSSPGSSPFQIPHTFSPPLPLFPSCTASSSSCLSVSPFWCH